MKRQHYIDNLRWICILILIPFHTAMAWNTWESNYIWFGTDKFLSSFVIFVCPYYMPLLFVLAGMSMNFALRKRSYTQFLME
ncbi:MAG: acyltransferase family protein [Clostridia bacterium]|nr:acyltransferase family protein [Clostridia bacterium]